MNLTITFDPDLTPEQHTAQRARLVALARAGHNSPPAELRPFWHAVLLAVDDDDRRRRAERDRLFAHLYAPPVVGRDGTV